jgi:hypothetical protein
MGKSGTSAPQIEHLYGLGLCMGNSTPARPPRIRPQIATFRRQAHPLRIIDPHDQKARPLGGAHGNLGLGGRGDAGALGDVGDAPEVTRPAATCSGVERSDEASGEVKGIGLGHTGSIARDKIGATGALRQSSPRLGSGATISRK